MSKKEYLNNTFYKSFSGSDSLAFLILPEAKPILLGSLTTISYSMYRDKKPVSLVGKINVSGYTRGMRVIAGTMVFTLINQHLTKDLVAQVPYLASHGKIKADELPMFDIMVVCANEYGYSTKMQIYGVDITDDAQVLSIEDIFTENTFNFVARDLDEFTATNVVVSSGSNKRSRYIDSVMPYDFYINEYENNALKLMSSCKNEDLMKVQVKLKEAGSIDKVTGVMDNDTHKAICDYQYARGINPTGVLDETTYRLITDKSEDHVFATIENKNGAFVYDTTNKDKIIGISKYREGCRGRVEKEFLSIDFYGCNGYVSIEDTNLFSAKKCTFVDKSDNKCTIVEKIKDFNAHDIGSVITANKDIEIKVTTISEYRNGNKKEYSKFAIINEGESKDINLTLIPEGYFFNVDNGDVPSKIEFVVYPIGDTPKKWNIEIVK